MAITTITKYPKTILMDGNAILGNDGDYDVVVEDIEDGNVYVHTATLKLGNQVLEFPLFASGLTSHKRIPKEWNNEVPNATSRIGTFTVVTKKQIIPLVLYTQVEVNTVNITFQVPTDIRPSIMDLTSERIDGIVPFDWNVYVQNYSKCKLEAEAEGSYGSTIKRYKFKLNGMVQSNQTDAEYTHLCTMSGNLKFTVTAIDSRGRESEESEISISVESYEKPRINSVVCFRCDETGTDTDKGTYVFAYVNYIVSEVGGKNTATCKVNYSEGETGVWNEEAAVVIENNSPSVLFGFLSTEMSYKISFLVKDGLSEAEYTSEVSTFFVTREYLSGGDGVSFGKTAELKGYFDNAFKTLLRQGFELPNTDWHQLTCNVSTAIGGTTPEYQQLGHIVKIRGNVTGIAARGKVIANLPEEARPSSNVTAIGAATGNCITFWSVGTNGNITLLFCFNLATGAESYELNSYDFNITYLI